MTDYADFRQRLDAVLRTLDVKQVREFLIAEGQWQPGTPTDPEAAMWMMIAGSPTLRDLHARAGEWLIAHGHENEAQAILGRSKKQQQRPGKSSPQLSAAKGEKQGKKSQKIETRQQKLPKRDTGR